MKVTIPSHKILFMPSGTEILENITLAGRTCYTSKKRITPDSASQFVKRTIQNNHLSVIEHASATVKFVCDRGISHELVRHRLAAYSQESTRYVNYCNEENEAEITVIRPLFFDLNSPMYLVWHRAMQQCENAYISLVNMGARPEQARCVLPNSLKTELVMTANLREWRHVLSLRCGNTSHPQMREIMIPLLRDFTVLLPAVFEDIHCMITNNK